MELGADAASLLLLMWVSGTGETGCNCLALTVDVGKWDRGDRDRL